MTIVVKIGGSLLSGEFDPSLFDDVKALLAKEKVVLVHGGADEVSRVSERMGKSPTFVVSPGGIRSRYTDRETVEIFTMVMAGKINKEVVAALEARAVPAIGVSGVDGSILRASRKKRLVIIDERGRKRLIDGGYTGKIEDVNTGLLRLLVDNGYVPVVAPVALGDENEFLNVDADRAAAYVAAALHANVVIFLTDVPGVLKGEEVIPKMTLTEAQTVRSRVGAGMDKKLLAASEAVEKGVKRAVIAPGKGSNPVSAALDNKTGTVIESG
jgi:acetylglutamate/LysW-gamma-L-alpha-aminoadipate kinase